MGKFHGTYIKNNKELDNLEKVRSRTEHQLSPIAWPSDLTPPLPRLQVLFLTAKEIRKIEEIFGQLDADGSGQVDFKEVQMVPELLHNPFVGASFDRRCYCPLPALLVVACCRPAERCF